MEGMVCLLHDVARGGAASGQVMEEDWTAATTNRPRVRKSRKTKVHTGKSGKFSRIRVSEDLLERLRRECVEEGGGEPLEGLNKPQEFFDYSTMALAEVHDPGAFRKAPHAAQGVTSNATPATGSLYASHGCSDHLSSEYSKPEGSTVLSAHVTTTSEDEGISEVVSLQHLSHTEGGGGGGDHTPKEQPTATPLHCDVDRNAGYTPIDSQSKLGVEASSPSSLDDELPLDLQEEEDDEDYSSSSSLSISSDSGAGTSPDFSTQESAVRAVTHCFSWLEDEVFALEPQLEPDSTTPADGGAREGRGEDQDSQEREEHADEVGMLLGMNVNQGRELEEQSGIRMNSEADRERKMTYISGDLHLSAVFEAKSSGETEPVRDPNADKQKDIISMPRCKTECPHDLQGSVVCSALGSGEEVSDKNGREDVEDVCSDNQGGNELEEEKEKGEEYREKEKDENAASSVPKRKPSVFMTWESECRLGAASGCWGLPSPPRGTTTQSDTRVRLGKEEDDHRRRDLASMTKILEEGGDGREGEEEACSDGEFWETEDGSSHESLSESEWSETDTCIMRHPCQDSDGLSANAEDSDSGESNTADSSLDTLAIPQDATVGARDQTPFPATISHPRVSLSSSSPSSVAAPHDQEVDAEAHYPHHRHHYPHSSGTCLGCLVEGDRAARTHSRHTSDRSGGGGGDERVGGKFKHSRSWLDEEDTDGWVDGDNRRWYRVGERSLPVVGASEHAGTAGDERQKRSVPCSRQEVLKRGSCKRVSEWQHECEKEEDQFNRWRDLCRRLEELSRGHTRSEARVDGHAGWSLRCSPTPVTHHFGPSPLHRVGVPTGESPQLSPARNTPDHPWSTQEDRAAWDKPSHPSLGLLGTVNTECTSCRAIEEVCDVCMQEEEQSNSVQQPCERASSESEGDDESGSVDDLCDGGEDDDDQMWRTNDSLDCYYSSYPARRSRRGRRRSRTDNRASDLGRTDSGGNRNYGEGCCGPVSMEWGPNVYQGDGRSGSYLASDVRCVFPQPYPLLMQPEYCQDQSFYQPSSSFVLPPPFEGAAATPLAAAVPLHTPAAPHVNHPTPLHYPSPCSFAYGNPQQEYLDRELTTRESEYQGSERSLHGREAGDGGTGGRGRQPSAVGWWWRRPGTRSTYGYSNVCKKYDSQNGSGGRGSAELGAESGGDLMMDGEGDRGLSTPTDSSWCRESLRLSGNPSVATFRGVMVPGGVCEAQGAIRRRPPETGNIGRSSDGDRGREDRGGPRATLRPASISDVRGSSYSFHQASSFPLHQECVAGTRKVGESSAIIHSDESVRLEQRPQPSPTTSPHDWPRGDIPTEAGGWEEDALLCRKNSWGKFLSTVKPEKQMQNKPNGTTEEWGPTSVSLGSRHVPSPAVQQDAHTSSTLASLQRRMPVPASCLTHSLCSRVPLYKKIQDVLCRGTGVLTPATPDAQRPQGPILSQPRSIIKDSLSDDGGPQGPISRDGVGASHCFRGLDAAPAGYHPDRCQGNHNSFHPAREFEANFGGKPQELAHREPPDGTASPPAPVGRFLQRLSEMLPFNTHTEEHDAIDPHNSPESLNSDVFFQQHHLNQTLDLDRSVTVPSCQDVWDPGPCRTIAKEAYLIPPRSRVAPSDIPVWQGGRCCSSPLRQPSPPQPPVSPLPIQPRECASLTTLPLLRHSAANGPQNMLPTPAQNTAHIEAPLHFIPGQVVIGNFTDDPADERDCMQHSADSSETQQPSHAEPQHATATSCTTAELSDSPLTQEWHESFSDFASAPHHEGPSSIRQCSASRGSPCLSLPQMPHPRPVSAAGETLEPHLSPCREPQSHTPPSSPLLPERHSLEQDSEARSCSRAVIPELASQKSSVLLAVDPATHPSPGCSLVDLLKLGSYDGYVTLPVTFKSAKLHEGAEGERGRGEGHEESCSQAGEEAELSSDVNISTQVRVSLRKFCRRRKNGSKKLIIRFTLCLECAGCKEELVEGQALIALDQQWHIWCFKCAICSTVLHGEYMGKDGLPYCEKDYQAQFGVKCAYCNRFISGKVLQAGDNHHFHPTCARCTKCGDPFGDGEEMYLQGTAIWHPRCGPGPTENGTVLNGSLSNGHHINGEQKAERERDFDGMSSTASETQFSRSRTPSLNGSFRSYSPYNSLNRKFSGPYRTCSPGLILREYKSSQSPIDITRIYTYSYLTAEPSQGYLKRPLDPYDRPPPKSPHFHRPPTDYRKLSLPKTSSRLGMRVLVDQMQADTPRPKSPHMNNEEPIILSHYPGGRKPISGDVSRIERDDFPAPPYPYTDPDVSERRRRWSGSNKAVSIDETDEGTELEDDGLVEDPKLKREEAELSKIATGIGKVFLQQVKEREKIRAWKATHLDPRNASRTPAADREPGNKLRFGSSLNASPSRMTDHSRPWGPEEEEFDRGSSYRCSTGRSSATIPSYNVVSALRGEPKPGYGLKSSTLPAAGRNGGSAGMIGDYTFSGLGEKTQSTEFSSARSDVSAGSLTEADRSALNAELCASATYSSGLRGYSYSPHLRRSLPNMHHMSSEPPKIYPAHLLLVSNYRLPNDVDRCHLERHLSDTDFEMVFHMTRMDFYRLPEWRRNDLKRRAKFF